MSRSFKRDPDSGRKNFDKRREDRNKKRKGKDYFMDESFNSNKFREHNKFRDEFDEE